MNISESVEVNIYGPVDWLSAQDLSARIRIAIRNEIPEIFLVFDRSSQISSAEFLAFLTVAAKEAEKKGQRLRIRGASGKVHSLLQISRLSHLIDDVAKTPPVLIQEK